MIIVQELYNLEICAANFRIIRAHIQGICAYITGVVTRAMGTLKVHQLIN